MYDDRKKLVPFSGLIRFLYQELGLTLHISTLHRWRTKGAHGLRLKAVRLGGRWFATPADVLSLIQGDTPDLLKPPPAARAAVAQAQLATRHKLPMPQS